METEYDKMLLNTAITIAKHEIVELYDFDCYHKTKDIYHKLYVDGFENLKALSEHLTHSGKIVYNDHKLQHPEDKFLSDLNITPTQWIHVKGFVESDFGNSMSSRNPLQIIPDSCQHHRRRFG